MKKMSYIVLPTLLLLAGTITGFAGNLPSEIKKDLPKFKNFKQEVSVAKEEQQKMRSQGIIVTPAGTEISFNQRIDLQAIVSPHKTDKIEAKTYKLKLNKEKTYALLEQKNFTETKEKFVKWHWNDFLGKYSYEFTFSLASDSEGEKFLMIDINPISSDEPTVPYAYVSFSQNENDIYYSGMAYAMDTHSGFGRRILTIK